MFSVSLRSSVGERVQARRNSDLGSLADDDCTRRLQRHGAIAAAATHAQHASAQTVGERARLAATARRRAVQASINHHKHTQACLLKVKHDD